MPTKKTSISISPEELEGLLKETATPIDFEGLEESGVLERRGSWHVILKFNELPPSARNKIKSIKQNKKMEVLVKFQTVSKKTEKLFKSLQSQEIVSENNS
jgi:hypothetical protein